MNLWQMGIKHKKAKNKNDLTLNNTFVNHFWMHGQACQPSGRFIQDYFFNEG